MNERRAAKNFDDVIRESRQSEEPTELVAKAKAHYATFARKAKEQNRAILRLRVLSGLMVFALILEASHHFRKTSAIESSNTLRQISGWPLEPNLSVDKDLNIDIAGKSHSLAYALGLVRYWDLDANDRKAFIWATGVSASITNPIPAHHHTASSIRTVFLETKPLSDGSPLNIKVQMIRFDATEKVDVPEQCPIPFLTTGQRYMVLIVPEVGEVQAAAPHMWSQSSFDERMVPSGLLSGEPLTIRGGCTVVAISEFPDRLARIRSELRGGQERWLGWNIVPTEGLGHPSPSFESTFIVASPNEQVDVVTRLEYDRGWPLVYRQEQPMHKLKEAEIRTVMSNTVSKVLGKIILAENDVPKVKEACQVFFKHPEIRQAFNWLADLEAADRLYLSGDNCSRWCNLLYVVSETPVKK